MTQDMYLVSMSAPQLGTQLKNGVVAAIVNASSATKAKQNAALAASAAFAPATNADDTEADFYQSAPSYPATYFDTAVKISADAGQPASGNGTANGDAWILPERSPVVYVDHSAYTPIA